VLLDIARALIQHHDPVSREVVVTPKPHAFPSLFADGDLPE
jgi:hypothetical protein